MKTFSNSKLSCFEQCPLKFKFHYIDKIETEIETTVEAFLGEKVHETLEKLYKDLKFQKMNSLKELLKFFNEEWKKNWNDAIVIVKNEYSEENYKKMGEKYITDYYNRYKPFDQAKTIGLETKGFVDIGNYKIHVRIDRLAVDGDTYEIHDYKTNNSLPTQEKIDHDRQLAIYACGVKKMYPDAKKIRLIWHFLAFDKEMISSRTDEDLEKMKEEVIDVINAILSCKDYSAKESNLCEWCEFRPLCPNFKHLYEIEDMPAEEYLEDDGVKMVNEYAVLDKEIKEREEKLERIRDALISFAKSNKVDVVYGSDVKASVKSYPKLSFPKKDDPNRDEFFSMVNKIGLWDRLAVVDTYELAKMINKGELNDELKKLLDKFIEKVEINVIRVRKKLR